MKDYYAILEISTNATQEQIKDQWRFLVHAWHPDKFPNSTQKLKAEEKIKEINEAYDILSNSIKRARYDTERKGSRFYEDERRDQKARTEAEQHRAEQERQQKQQAEDRQRRAEYERQQRKRAEDERQRKEEEQRQRAYSEAERIRVEKERQYKIQRFTRISSITFLVILIGSLALYLNHQRILEEHYQAGISAMNAKRWDVARAEFVNLEYKDSSILYLETYYQQAKDAFNHERYSDAITAFEQLMTLSSGYKDTSSMLTESYLQRALGVIRTNIGNCGHSTCSPEMVVEKAFSGYIKSDDSLVESLMTTEGQSNSDYYCQGKAINCLKSNYSGAGNLFSLATTLISSSNSSADVQLKTNWSEKGMMCQDYQLDFENGGWGITFFNVPRGC